MTEEERLENQAYYLSVCKARGWLNEVGQHCWPVEIEARKTMARELFGLALTNALDSAFVTYRDRLMNLDLGLTEQQKKGILLEYDQLLDFAMYEFCITLDRFDHGELTLCHKPEGAEADAQQINPHGWFELFQDAPRWKEEFGRGLDIGRGDAQPAVPADGHAPAR